MRYSLSSPFCWLATLRRDSEVTFQIQSFDNLFVSVNQVNISIQDAEWKSPPAPLVALQPNAGHGLPILDEVLLDHTQRCTTVSRTPLDE